MPTALLELEENTLFKPLRGRLKLLQTFEYHCSCLLFFYATSSYNDAKLLTPQLSTIIPPNLKLYNLIFTSFSFTTQELLRAKLLVSRDVEE